MAETPNLPGRPVARGWRIAFFASLALNLLILGVVGGALIKGPPHMRPDMVRDLGFGPFTEALDEGDRAALRKAFKDRAPDLRTARHTMRADFAALLAALRADPFDPVALESALARQSVRSAERLALGQQLLRDRLAEMTVDARRAFADRLEASLTRRKHKP